ncbi:unnamed protein product [Parajaminaea phylloscopi]
MLSDPPQHHTHSANSIDNSDDFSSERTPTATAAPAGPLSALSSSSPPQATPSQQQQPHTMAASVARAHQPDHSMSKSSSSSMEHAAFDLPPMPVPYEDFHFSLDLPDNVHASDLSLIDASNFETLFGSSGGSLTPSIVSNSALFGTATPAILSPSASGPGDSLMTSMSTPSSAARPPEPIRAPAQPSLDQAPRGPPPPPDFEPPTQGGFSFDSLFGGDGGGGDEATHGRITSPPQHAGMASMTIPSSSSSLPLGQKQPMGGQHLLFDTNETDFLSNFLEGFEASWDFNPALPQGMPSFAAAAALHGARGMSNGNVNQYGGGGGGEGETPTSAGSNATVTSPLAGPSGSSRRAKGSKRGNSKTSDGPTPPGVVGDHASFFGDAFGGHLDAAEDVSQGIAGIGSKRGGGTGPRIGDEKRRASLAPGGGGGGGGGGDHTAPASFVGGQFQPHTHQPMLHGYHVQPPHPPHPDGHRLMGWPGAENFGPMAPHPQQVAHPHLLTQHQRQLRAQNAAGPSNSIDETEPDSPSHSRDSSAAGAAAKRELLTEKEKRQNHILSEQRRRNHIREGFTELVALLDLGRLYGARGLGLSSGAGTGIEDEGLDDRTDVSSGEESDPEAAALAKARRKKAKSKRAAALNAAAAGHTANTGASRGKGKGRGRGGSAGGGAGSKSAVLFQAVDLVKWLEVRNAALEQECESLEKAADCGSEPVVATGAAKSQPVTGTLAKVSDEQDRPTVRPVAA